MSARHVKIFVCIFCIIFITSFLHGQPSNNTGQQHEIQNYVANNYSVENQNWSISQNPLSGYVYFANSNGLVECNGIGYKTYHLPAQKSVRSVFTDDMGIVFTGSFEEFGYWQLNHSGNLNYHSLSATLGMEKNDEIWKIYASFDKIYFQSFTAIYIYDYKTVKKVKAPFTMLFMFQTGSRFIAQILGSGLYWFNGDDFQFIAGSEIFNNTKVHAIFKRSNNELFICTATNGIYTFNGKRFVYFKSEATEFLKAFTCNAGCTIGDTVFVFGTISNGLLVTNNEGKILKHYNFANGLNNNTVLSLYKNKDNGLWVGLDNGSNYIDVNSPFALYRNTTGTLGTIYSVLRNNNNVYFGTNHGLFKADLSEHNGMVDVNNICFVPNSNGQVWTINQFGNQIICGHNDGTFAVKNDGFQRISHVTGGWCIKKYNDLLVEGTYTGLIFLSEDGSGNWHFRNQVKGYGEPSRHVEVDYRGYIWTSHFRKGIYRLELNDALDSVVQTDYYSIASEKSGNWDIATLNNQIVFTTADSLCTFDYASKKIVPLKILNASLGTYRQSTQISHYLKNEYWFFNGNKLALFSITKEFVATKLQEITLKQSENTDHDRPVIPISDTYMLLSDQQLFSIYNLSMPKHKSQLPGIHIAQISFQGNDSLIQFYPTASGNIHVPFYTNNITINFGYPGYLSHQEKQYHYMIAEIDQHWHNTHDDVITYQHLRHGQYHLKIKTDNNESAAELTFIIDRPWYYSWLAFIAYGALLVVMVVLVFKFFKYELHKQKTLIEYQLKGTKLESELDYKNYELMLTMRYMIQKNEIFTELQAQIVNLKESAGTYPIKFIKNLEHIINEGLESQTEEWKTTMNSLKLSQQGFFKELKERYPNLTQNDLRLCSYLRMNFTTKEIAKLLNISARAVEISRYRLRRKLNLTHDDNLTDFLIKASENLQNG